MKNPEIPDRKNHLKSSFLGAFILKTTATTTKKIEATKYRIKAMEYTEKYCNKIFVKT
jgi:hypothetical protein